MSVMANHKMEKEKHKGLGCFIISVYSLKPWKQVEMEVANRHNVLDSFLFLVGNNSSSIFQSFHVFR